MMNTTPTPTPTPPAATTPVTSAPTNLASSADTPAQSAQSAQSAQAATQPAHQLAEQSAAQPALFRPPQISWRWVPVFQRNLLVWRKLAVPSLVGNIAEPLITLVAFGYGIGALVGQVQLNGAAVPYILFLASGSICMSAMNAASFEALYSAFSRMQVQRTWDGIMNAPVRLDDVVLAEMLWAAFKSLFTSVVILGVMLALGISHSPMLLLALPLLALVGIVFASIALIFNALAKGYDFFTYYFSLFLTPTMFLSGVFFPRDQLPAVVREISGWLPLTAAVELIRPLFLGQWPTQAGQHLAVLVAYGVGAFWVALALTRRRFRG